MSDHGHEAEVTRRADPSLHHIQVTTSLGEMQRHGFVWVHGDRYNWRIWLALRLIDREAARLYFTTTCDGI